MTKNSTIKIIGLGDLVCVASSGLTNKSQATHGVFKLSPNQASVIHQFHWIHGKLYYGFNSDYYYWYVVSQWTSDKYNQTGICYLFLAARKICSFPEIRGGVLSMLLQNNNSFSKRIIWFFLLIRFPKNRENSIFCCCRPLVLRIGSSLVWMMISF